MENSFGNLNIIEMQRRRGTCDFFWKCRW